jgi:3D-(3,5/4)-trihydroxycyclohexane-1,2-dione acylhydrolase (decyclizing)
VIVIDTTHERITAEGGCWWQVGVPEVSQRPEVLAAHDRWQEAQANQRL